MTFQSRTTLLAVIGLCAVGVVVGVGIRQFFGGPVPHDLPPDAVPQAEAAIDHFVRTRLVDAADQEQVKAILTSARDIQGQTDEVALSDDVRRGFGTLVAEWLSLRSRADADAYASWMRSRGYELTLDLPDGETYLGMSESDRQRTWKYFTGEDLPSGVTPLEFFRVCFTESLNVKGGFLRPKRVSDDVLVTFRAIPVTRSNPRPLPIDEFPDEDRWVGFATSGDRQHWSPALSYGDVMRRDNVVITAVMLVAVEGAKGQWAPMTITGYYDMATQQWHLLSTTYSNSMFRGIAIER